MIFKYIKEFYQWYWEENKIECILLHVALICSITSIICIILSYI